MLREEIERIRNIPNPEKLNEKTTQTALILPMLRALNWNTADPDEVILEYSVGKHLKGSVDIALMLPNSPLAFVEAKAVSVNLQANEKSRNQLLDYCVMESVSVGVLTNGIIWEFYYVGNIASRENNPPPAEVFNIKEDDVSELINCFTRLLSRDSLFDNSAKESLRQALEQKHIQIVWNELLRSGDERIAKVLRQELNKHSVTKLSVEQSREYVREQFNNYQSGKQVPRVQESPAEIVTDSTNQLEEKINTKAKSRKPAYIIAFGNKRDVNSWKEVKTNFISVLIETYPELLNGRLFELCNTKGKEFVVRGHQVNLRNFSEPKEIDSSNIWTETHASANGLVANCRAILKQLGMSQDELKVVCEESDSD